MIHTQGQSLPALPNNSPKPLQRCTQYPRLRSISKKLFFSYSFVLVYCSPNIGHRVNERPITVARPIIFQTCIVVYACSLFNYTSFLIWYRYDGISYLYIFCFRPFANSWRWFYHHSDLTAHTTLFVHTFPLWLLITQRTSLRSSLS